jgi:mRNA interferase MazF
MPAPRRGEVWLVDLGMVAKVRPCLVLNVPVGPQDCVLATLVGHTTSTRGSQFEVAVQVRFLQAGAFDAQSLVTVPHAKLIRRQGTCRRPRSCQSRMPCGGGLGCDARAVSPGAAADPARRGGYSAIMGRSRRRVACSRLRMYGIGGA